jgi:hypothetical protein
MAVLGSDNITHSTTFKFNINSADRVSIDSSGRLGIGITNPGAELDVFRTGTTSSILRTRNDTTTVYLDANNAYAYLNCFTNHPLLFGTNDTERARFLPGGGMTVGTTANDSNAFVTIAGNITSSVNNESWFHAYVPNGVTNRKRWRFGGSSLGFWILQSVNDAYSSATTLMDFGDGGYMRIPNNYNLTTAAGANVHISADGTLFRSTSSLKYKKDIQDAQHGLKEIMNLRSVTYQGVNDGETTFGGLIAEEVHDAGLTEFVQYAEDGSPDALSYSNMVSICIKAIQEQQAIIEELKTRLSILETQ